MLKPPKYEKEKKIDVWKTLCFFLTLCIVINIIGVFHLKNISVEKIRKLENEKALLKREINQLEEKLKHFKMYYQDTYGEEYELEGYPTGLYFSGSDFMCVWLENRTYSEVMETCNHEWLHHKWGKEHFET